MIKWGSLLILLLGMVGYAYFGIYQEEKASQRVQKLLFAPEELTHLEKLNLTTEDLDIKLEKRDDQWWLADSKNYLADQDFIEKSLKIMESTSPSSWFEFKEDRFGFKPGKAFLQLVFDDGRQRRITVGTEEGPGDSLYVLERDQNQVFVVHNVWAQLLYFPSSHFLHKYLPIPGKLVKNVALYDGDSVIWNVDPAEGGKMKVHWEGKDHMTERAPWLWFFNKLREFPIENLEFEGKSPLKGRVLKIETNLGNISYVFSKKENKIHIPRLNVFAEVDPHSIKSLGNEIKKVISSDKK